MHNNTKNMLIQSLYFKSEGKNIGDILKLIAYLYRKTKKQELLC